MTTLQESTFATHIGRMNATGVDITTDRILEELEVLGYSVVESKQTPSKELAAFGVAFALWAFIIVCNTLISTIQSAMFILGWLRWVAG